MPIGSIIGGVIGQQGSQQGGDMAYNASSLGGQMAMNAANTAAARNDAEALRGRNALSPWTSLGLSSVNKLANLYGLGHTRDVNGDGNVTLDTSTWQADRDAAYKDFKASPGFQFRLDQGTNALDRSAASRGLVLSGAQKMGVQDYAQGRASDEWGNYINALSGFSGQGEGAASSGNTTSAGLVGQGSNAIASAGTAAGNMLTAGGASRGSAYASGANALASGLSKGSQNAAAILGYGGSGGKLGLPGWK